MHVLKTDFNGNPSVGLFCWCDDSLCLAGKEVQSNRIHLLGEALHVPVHQVTMCGTSLLGVFLAGNSNALLVPEIAFDSELHDLKRLGLKCHMIRSKATALGNNILCNDHGALISREFTDSEMAQIQKALCVPVKKGTIAGLDTVGSLGVLNSRGCVVHRDISAAEKKLIESLLKVECVPSTVNMGSPYIHSGLLCNDKGMVVGDLSGGPEIVEAEEALGFLREKL